MTTATLQAIEESLVRAHGFRRERSRVSGGVVLPRFADVRFSGRLDGGRRATVGFAGVGARTRVRLAVAADEAARFAVARHGWLEWLGATFGLAERWEVDADGDERAVLARQAVRDAIDRFFLGRGAESLELARGELVAQLSFFAIEPRSYVPLLRELDELARHFDRAKLRVRVLRGVRRALSGAHGPRCAYCHDGLSGDEDGLVACEECSTVLHATCWEENAQCPILGCLGEHPEPRHLDRRDVGGGR